MLEDKIGLPETHGDYHTDRVCYRCLHNHDCIYQDDNSYCPAYSNFVPSKPEDKQLEDKMPLIPLMVDKVTVQEARLWQRDVDQKRHNDKLAAERKKWADRLDQTGQDIQRQREILVGDALAGRMTPHEHMLKLCDFIDKLAASLRKVENE